MKKAYTILTALLLALCISATSYAQKKPVKTEKSKQQTTSQVQDGIIMQNGKMMMMKQGNTFPMTQDMTLTDGTKVMKNGTVVRPDGQTTMMSNGDVMTMSGQLRLGGMEADQPITMPNESMKPGTSTTAPGSSTMTMESMEQRMNMMNEKMRLMNEKMRLLNDKMTMMKGAGAKNTDTSQMDQEIKRLDEQMRQLDSQMKR